MKQEIFKKYLYKKDLKKYYYYKDISKSKSNFIEFLNQIESEFYSHKFKSDERFIVCDRFQSLIEEMEELYWTKEQVIEKNYISPTKWCIKSLQEILIENNAVMDIQKDEYRKVYEEYCKDGIVSLEERDFILYAINMMKSSLKKCNDNLDWFESNEKKADAVLDENEKINIVIPKMEYKEAEIYEEYVDENGNVQHRTKKIKIPTGKILGNETKEKEKYVYGFIPYEKIDNRIAMLESEERFDTIQYLISKICKEENEEMKKIIFSIVKDIDDKLNDVETNIAKIINYDPKTKFIEPLEQRKILNYVREICDELNITLVRKKREFGGLAFYSDFIINK